ncbi:MAG: class I SAM-dependent methyltransferase [Deltaproteobacteria bacterium]|jgi:predicted O-methyltransferase YrrM
MSPRTIKMDDEVYSYFLDISVREHDVLRRLREETQAMEHARMQIAPEQGQFMRLLVELLDARRTIEVGTFTGYSALATALALPEDGKVIACDVSEEWTSIGRRYWEEAGVASKIDLRIGPANDTLDSLIAEGGAGEFDFMFIDADKSGYPSYYEKGLALLRKGGLIGIDNALWGGSIADASDTGADTEAIREIDRRVRDDDRVTSSLVPIGDGLLLARKR